MSAGWCFQAVWVRRRENVMAGGTSGCPRGQSYTKVDRVVSFCSMEGGKLGATGGMKCSEIFQSYCQTPEFLYRLTRLIRRLGRCG